ncbi:MAG TPA: HAD-IC family P-type ATPase [Streptosporangiaceae bacterium]|nr:HAD-IC family P-type ATPase [Streptosporangiaceae bacterium]
MAQQVTRLAPSAPVDPAIGLRQADVRVRVAAGQVNAVPRPPGRTVGQILRANLFTRFNAILGGLFAVALVIGPPQDALFGIVLAANTAIGIAQELRAKRTLDRLAILTAARARVVRDGAATELPTEAIVIDDVIEAHPGDQVAVDAVVLSSEGLELDEALLTGEAEPARKAPGDRVLSGSFVVAGTGQLQASGVGGSAYAARLEAEARRFSLIRSELQQGTNWILRLVTWVMVPAGLLLVLSQLFRSNAPLGDALRGSVAGVGAMVPEGLVLLTSIAFAVGAVRLARRHVLVQELAAIEGLARVDVLCIDKTGTLTAPGMVAERIEPVSGRTVGEIEEVIGAFAAADPAPNATMAALAERCPAPAGWTVTAQVPFSSARKWSAVTFDGLGTWVIGAPGVVGRNLPPGIAGPVGSHEAAGRRVLVLSGSAEPADGTALPGGLTPVALLVLAERLREDAAATVRYLLDQGITIKVLSGDAPRTVSAIAGRVGIPAHDAMRDASELGDDETSVGGALRDSNVLGRVRPGQKLAAVRALQADGHVVAMVGDGVNDVQALKQADLGIAMGSGSQSSRSVARVVLLDSSFAAIPAVLAEGRRVIANIERVANLFVTKTVYAAALAIVVGLSGIPFPFFPRHLTIVSTLTIGVPGFFLALAAGAPRARSGFTRRVLAFTIPAGLAAAGAAAISYALARSADAATAEQSRTATLLALFAISLWVLALIARPLNAARVVLIAALAAAFATVFTWPFARQVFSLRLPPAAVTLQVAGVVLAAIAALTLWRRFAPARLRGSRIR